MIDVVHDTQEVFVPFFTVCPDPERLKILMV